MVSRPALPRVARQPGGLPLVQRKERCACGGFSAVRIRRDAAAAQSADALHARAYTVGDRIVFGRAAYAPDSSEGERLIAHELAHVVQQRDSTPAGATTVHRQENTEVDDIIVWHYINEAMERNDNSLWDAWGDLMEQREADPLDPNLAAAEHYFTARFLAARTPLPSFFVADMAMGYGVVKDFMRDELGIDPSFSDSPTTKSTPAQVKYGMWGAFDGSWWGAAYEAIFE